MRSPGSASSAPAELDQAIGSGQEYGAIGYMHAGSVDRPLAAYKLGTSAAVASRPRFYGRVSYLPAGGIDRPLSIWKDGVGSVRPHENWRGQFARYMGRGAAAGQEYGAIRLSGAGRRCRI